MRRAIILRATAGVLCVTFTTACRQGEPEPRYNRNLGQDDVYLLPTPPLDWGPPLPAQGRVEIPDRQAAEEGRLPVAPAGAAEPSEAAEGQEEGLTGKLLDWLKGRP